MSPTSPPWQDRHDTIREALRSTSVKAALRDFQISRSIGQNLCTTATSEADGTTGDAETSPLLLSKLLDISLSIAWSAVGLSPTKDANPFRAAASPSLFSLRQASLQVSDFKTLKVLQKSAGSLVEVVKNRLDGRVYVLKSLVKGFARRNAAIQTPINETKLLQTQASKGGRASRVDQAPQLLTPQLLAAFQTQHSVHVLMEYVPSGDFSEMLLAASNCGTEYPGRASTGLLIEDWILRYSVDMIQAIAWVHGQGFAHRDIKPGNFLLDRSGHLKLCDFSSAAPFSAFSVTQLSGQASRTRRASTSTKRKVWAFYCSLPTGTCDYLSPEVLEAEEKRVLERQEQYDMSSLDDMLGFKRKSRLLTPNGEVPQASPGTYGPEVDWWSFGVMLYEMRFGILPFFASRMEETYEKIKDHRSSLKFEPCVACSGPLKNLIQSLLTEAEFRLGHMSSEEVQQHEFYGSHAIDWSKQWPLQAPFMPNANSPELQSPHPSVAVTVKQQGNRMDGIPPHFKDQSLSVMSSVPSFSALYSGDPDDFPAFVDSRELQSESVLQRRSWWDGERSAELNQGATSVQHHDIGEATATDIESAAPDATLPSMPRSSSSPAVVLNSAAQSEALRNTSSALGGAASPCITRSAPRWSDCDATFIGFSYLPDREAFPPATPLQEGCSPGEMSTAASLDDLVPSLAGSPKEWPISTPVASTPFHRAGGQSSHSLTVLPTPPSFAPSPIGAFAETAEPAGPEARPSDNAHTIRASVMPFAQQQHFVTPARKPSYMAMHERYRQMQGQGAPIPEDALANATPAVPPSPYPFPVASAARSTKFTGGKKPMLHRRDLDRARSATPGGGSVGSDSRQSGGSNAVREMSEREAWDEMMAAVQKSVRKKQPPAAEFRSPLTSSASPPTGLPRSSTDPELSASKPNTAEPSRRSKLQDPADAMVPQDDSVRSALHPLKAPRQGTERADPRVETQEEKAASCVQPTLHQRRSRATLIAPRATFKSIAPDSPESLQPGHISNEPSRQSALPPSQYAMDIDMYDSEESDDSAAGRRNLRHKKSARQLLIRAQERGTPTKPKRAQSPPLTEAFAPAPSVAAVLEAAGARSSPPILLGDQSMRSYNSSRDVSYEHSADFVLASGRVRAMSIQRSEKASSDISNEALSSSLGKNSVTFAPMAYVPVLGAIPHWRDPKEGPASLDGHGDPLGAPREPGRSTKTIRRKDSGEMLSQYRKVKEMGRATSMLSLSERAKADADAHSARPGTALSSSPLANSEAEDDFILGHVESRTRLMAPGGSLPGRTIRRFSSVLSLKERERVSIERPASQDGAARTSRGFGRFKSRITSSTLCEEPNEGLASAEAESKSEKQGQTGALHRTRRGSNTAVAVDQQTRHAAFRLGRKMGDTLPRSFAIRSSSSTLASSAPFKRSGLTPSLEEPQVLESPDSADLSLMSGLNQRHNALQGSLLGLEHRLARLKARLED